MDNPSIGLALKPTFHITRPTIRTIHPLKTTAHHTGNVPTAIPNGTQPHVMAIKFAKIADTDGKATSEAPARLQTTPSNKLAYMTQLEIRNHLLRRNQKRIINHNISTLLLTISIICLIGTIFTNIQQYAQYSRVKEEIAEEKAKIHKYEDLKLLFDTGIINNEPCYPSINNHPNRFIETPYNCLNIPISILFWVLACL